MADTHTAALPNRGASIVHTLPRRSALPAAGLLAGLARRALLAKFATLAEGRLRIIEAGHCSTFGPGGGLDVTLEVLHPAFYEFAAFGGSVGAGESYILGQWRADSLTDLVRLLVRNRHVLDTLESGLGRLTSPLLKAFHSLRRNTLAGSRRNIEAHYDLGNEFYRLWLDPTMTYSSGIFASETTTLEEASTAKCEALCRKLALSPADHVVEIGTGWGGFALHAARHHGCRVTTTTISREQYTLARQRIDAAGLADRITLLDRDYRELEGRFDKLVSIEMIEAVGAAFYPTFMQTCARLLKDDGLAALQAITIQDQLFEPARRSVDYIQRFIFPGSCIPSVTALCSAATRASDLRLVHLEDIGLHYARTLREWRLNVLDRADDIKALGFQDEFLRMWEFYLCYCEGGFAERNIGCAQLVFAKPRWAGRA